MSPLVLLHGFTGAPESFAPLLAELPVGLRWLAPPLLGHGATGTGGAFEGELARLEAIIRAWTEEPVHLVGYSLGARLGLGLLTRAPTRVVRATLIGGHPGLGDAAARERRRAEDQRWIELLEQGGIAAFVAEWATHPLFGSQTCVPAAQREVQRRIRLAHEPHGLATALRELGLGAMPHLLPELARVTVPVTLLAGALDVAGAERAHQMAAVLARGQARIVPDAGHNLLLERPSEVARVIVEGEPP